MKNLFLMMLLPLFVGACKTESTDVQVSLKVSENRRHLIKENGDPFLYLGDTAWELFHRLSREEADEYLQNRKEKGFTVIQAVVLAELDGLNTPNYYGDTPLIDLDPANPNEKYFEHVDYIVEKAEELGLFVGMLPTWGDKVPNDIGGVGPVVFNPENAENYGEFLGKRYRDKPIIWILGGDRKVDNETAHRIWSNMAKGLRNGDGGRHLISYHPRGVYSSSYWLHNEEWLDFNMYQTAHFHSFQKVYEHASHDYLLHPVKPTMDSEPAYEDIAKEFWTFEEWKRDSSVKDRFLDDDNLIQDREFYEKGYFTDYDVRVHGYWNLLSGTCGYTYGNNAVWQMFKRGDQPVIPCLYDWRTSLDRPGAQQIKYIKKLFEGRPFSKLLPDQSLIYGFNPKDENHIRSAVAEDGSFLMAYMAKGQPVSIVMKKVSGEIGNAWWYNPRNGEVTDIGEVENSGIREFVPPSSGLGNDWILVIEDPNTYKPL
jgi:hypothetical protein